MSDKIAFRTAKAPAPAAAHGQAVREGGVLAGPAEGPLVEIDALAVVG